MTSATSHSTILTSALADLANLRDIYEKQLAAVTEAMSQRDHAQLRLAASKIQKDLEIRQDAEDSGTKKPTEMAIAGQVTLALMREQIDLLELETTYRQASNQLDLVRFSIELKKLEIKANLPHANQIVNLTPPIATVS